MIPEILVFSLSGPVALMGARFGPCGRLVFTIPDMCPGSDKCPRTCVRLRTRIRALRGCVVGDRRGTAIAEAWGVPMKREDLTLVARLDSLIATVADTAARVSRYSYEVAHAEKARLYAVEVATLYAHRAQSAVRLADLLSRGVSS